MKLREVEDEAVGDYLAAKCTAGRPRWTSGLWSAAMPRVCYRTHMKTKTPSTKYVHTFIIQHLILSALNLIVLHTVHTNIH